MTGPRLRWLGSALVAVVVSIFLAAPAFADAGFQRWIQNFESVAAKNGVSRNVYRAAFAGVTSPDPDVLEKARYQPEFKDTVWDYVDNRVNDEQVAKGHAMRAKYDSWLDRIEKRFGVDRDILLAIWSMETNYGQILTRDDVMKSLPRSLATLAYLDKRRGKFARQQLIAALKIAQAGQVAPDKLISSWAGAMGHTQFIPTSYLAYAADIDGDGRANIWESVPDALATAANLLRKNGWQPGKTWGYEVVVPDRYQGKLERDNRSLGEWQSLGFLRPNGKGFPNPSDNANLVRLAGDNGPAFLMTKNFFVLKSYNNADKYALAVGMLGDRIGGYGGLYRDWPRGYTPLSSQERYELQKHLASRGLYDGKIDGKIGSGSKSAIMSLQGRAGMAQDGNASKALLEFLRRN
ncbi:lytic murein transglycosylase [Aurantimonas sp. C2-6-R+9]|uniref:lytic murein transglycosylase n=1 Tax=unclassified Aurantimonas TaxID=2638230 RepID=UPI002E19A8C9|nr:MULTISPECIES: lytic murein transglycosylase [unclassified Aurantimonas]MEC5289333.1 lytic murein transglycosylase [Aurantimonas sp. C2-3-R2]MEC5322932.1 lytic murein transglycosylase [Aurantimonas sp. A3-2-R12]MEC5382836.1 lytic murein transglycosylase [Aurantimonas sp. C2-6-R+9]MEC5410413.1 lytic murein transglycosylase [Aurantimonas sp. C2-4-R8]